MRLIMSRISDIFRALLPFTKGGLTSSNFAMRMETEYFFSRKGGVGLFGALLRKGAIFCFDVKSL